MDNASRHMEGRIPDMIRAEENNISVPAFISFPFLEQYGLFCGFTSRTGGYSRKPYNWLNLAYHVGDDRKAVKRNRLLVLEKILNSNTDCLYSARQAHGSRIMSINEQISHSGGDCGIEADGLMTDCSHVPVMVMGADCTLIILADIKNRAVCTVHAGWKGTLNGILASALKRFCQRPGSGQDNTMVFIGPCIRQCCYEIDSSLADIFAGKFGRGDHILQLNEKTYLDLAGLNRKQATQQGIPSSNIFDTGICTYCNEDYYSYRREKVTGRQAAIAMVA